LQRLCQTDENSYLIVLIEFFINYAMEKRQDQKRQKDKAARVFRLYRQRESASETLIPKLQLGNEK
jgi:hypothetical protein